MAAKTAVTALGRVSVSAGGGATTNFVSGVNLISANVTGPLSVTTSGGVTLLTPTGGSTSHANDIAVTGNLAVSGALTLNAAGAISQTGAIAAAGLTALGTSVTLANAANAIGGTLSVASPGNVILQNSVNTVLGATAGNITITVAGAGNPGVAFGGPVSATGTLSIHAAGSIGATGGSLGGNLVDLQSSTGQIGVTSGVPVPLMINAATLDAVTSNAAIALTLSQLTSGVPVIIGNTLGINAGTGNVALTANGLSQSAPIVANDLAITAPAISTALSPYLLNNSANAVKGTLSVNEIVNTNVASTGSIQFVNSQALTVGAITTRSGAIPPAGGIAGGVNLTTTSGGITVNGAIQAAGLTMTSAAGISVLSPITVSGLATMTAVGDITQNTGATTNVAIAAAGGLSVTSSGGLIRLDDGGHAGSVTDAGNAIGGFVRFASAGDTTFYNVGTILTGGPAITSSGSSSGTSVLASMTVGGNLVLQSLGASADIIFNNAIIVNGAGLTNIQAGRNVINYQGNGSLTVRNLGLYAPNGALGFTDGVSGGSYFLQVAAPGNNTLALQAASSALGTQSLIQVNGPLQLGSSLATGSALSGGVFFIINAGSLTQLSGAGGAISTKGLTVGDGFNSATGATPPNNVMLANPLNAVTGNVSFNVTGNVNFTNSVNTLIGTIGTSSTPSATPTNPNPTTVYTPAGNVDIEVVGASNPSLTLSGNSFGNGVGINVTSLVLHAAGSIFQNGTGLIAAGSVALQSDTGSIGTLNSPVALVASGNTAAAQAAGEIVLKLAPPSGATSGSIYFTSAGPLFGLNAGSSGFVDLFGTGIDVFADSVTASNFYFNTQSMSVDSLAAGSFGGQTTGGTIDISAASGANLVIGNTIPGVTTYGLDYGAGTLFLSADGAITQASGAAGLIKGSGHRGHYRRRCGDPDQSRQRHQRPDRARQPGQCHFLQQH